MGIIFGKNMAAAGTLPTKSIKPVLFINGCTGTGKSDLAIAIAKRFSGEVINADAMQLYRGLDIVTNKVTEVEMEGIPHHMMGILEPSNFSFTIHEYKQKAKSVIADIQSRNKMPVVVGGTNYYVDSLIWESLIPKHEDQESSARFEPEDDKPSEATLAFLKAPKILQDGEEVDGLFDHHNSEQLINSIDTNYLRLNCNAVDSCKLHSLLMAIDPDTAKTLHPNTVRKVIRAIEIYKHHGKTQSSFISEINQDRKEQSFGAPLCFKDAVVFWLQCNQEVLDKRLDERVDKMIERGLLKELESFYRSLSELAPEKDLTNLHGSYTRGIFQSIGFKEFHNYLLLSPDERESPKGIKQLQEGVESMKTATRRYARYQTKWVQKRFFEERNQEHVPPVYAFDSTRKEHFRHDVVEPAQALMDEIIKGKTPSSAEFRLEPKTREHNPVVYMKCDICDVLCVRKTEWDRHVTSRRHHKRLASHKRHLQMERHQLVSNLDLYEKSIRQSGIPHDNT